MASIDKVPEALHPLINALKSNFEDPKYIDLIVKCGERTWPVHKNILCPQSSFFAKACEKGWKESEENSVSLDDDEPSVVQAVLHYLYTFDYSDECDTNEQGGIPAIVFNLHMFVIADKLDIQHLGKLAASKFKHRCEEVWEKDAFAEAAEEVFKIECEGGQALRDTLISVASEHAKALKGKDSFCKAVSKVAPLAAALWGNSVSSNASAQAAKAEKDAEQRNYSCPYCSFHFTTETVLSGGNNFSCPSCRHSSYVSQWVA